jgi:hypothetical protein
MAALVQSEFVDTFDEKLFIKGFSNMLVPTEFNKDRGLVLWHLLYNVYGDRISYLDSNLTHAENVTICDLETSRHVLGWCSEAKCYAGLFSPITQSHHLVSLTTWVYRCC